MSDPPGFPGGFIFEVIMLKTLIIKIKKAYRNWRQEAKNMEYERWLIEMARHHQKTKALREKADKGENR